MALTAAKLWEKSRDWVVFGVCLLVALAVLLTRNAPVLRAARAGSLAVTARVEGAFSGVGRYTRALSENDRLRTQALELSAEVARLREARIENERLRALLGFADTLSVPHVLARVVEKDITQQENLLTINAGASDSIEVGMPVIDERGIVGKVVLVGRSHSLVMPHQNTRFSVPARLDRLQQDGIVRWDGRLYDRLLMEYVVKTEPVRRGDLVTTSGYSDVFPPGLPIGVVDSVFAARGRNDLVIYLRPAAPVSRVNYVYVLLAKPDPAQAALEAQAAAAAEGAPPVDPNRDRVEPDSL